MTIDDEKLLRRAIELARSAPGTGNPPFGSLLADRTGHVLAEERNTTLSDRDITAHPELKLARWTARELGLSTAATTTLFTSCQPCAMCVTAIQRAGIGRVVFALSSSQLQSLRPDGFTQGGDVIYEGPALYDDARAAIGDYYFGES